jgi:outer membrane protein assembly factor BamB
MIVKTRMSTTQVEQPTPSNPKPQKPLRLWPGVVAVALQWLAWFIVPRIAPEAAMFGVLAGVVLGLVVVLWWLLLSRAPWLERIGAIVLAVGAVIVTKRIVHPSIAGGMMGMMLPIFSIPLLCMALVVWAAATRRLSSTPRRALLVVAMMIACGVFTLVRTGGITGDAKSDLHWRWTKTPEERLLAQAKDEPVTPASAPAPAQTPQTRAPDQPVNAASPAAPAQIQTEPEAAWPGFRGPKRDGVVRGVHIETDWSQKPPAAIWRRPVGPGWSSFAVRGNLVYTQEQRGDEEEVSCYNLTSGKPVWRHGDPTRFYESNGGAGPRGTPTLTNGRVYTFGATGILNALDGRTGSVVWSRNAASDTKTKTPTWGFSSSPLVVGDVVIVAASGALAAYDIATGNPRWVGPTAGAGYSSPQLLTLDGVQQVLLMTGQGVFSVSPADGKLLWKYSWEGDSIVQPAVTADGDVLLGSGSGMGEVGVIRFAVTHGSAGWTTQQRWTSSGLKPYYNDFVVHKDLAFGFDGSILACIDLKSGERKWKGGRYGHGQLVLLPDQDLLLVVSEEGEVALVKAVPDQFTEVGKFKAIEGKTWNHPVLVGDTLLVRNSEEMAAFKISVASR